MTDQEDNPQVILVDRQIETAENYVRDNIYSNALAIYEDLFDTDSHRSAVYEGAARSAAAAILEDSWGEDWPRSRRDALYRHLILQRDRFGAPPAFHFQIARGHTSGRADILAKAAAELRPVLTALRDEGFRDHGLLLMALLLRAPLHDWIDQAELTRWHQELLPEFDAYDMAIPYNAMFDSTNFVRNITDIANLIERMQPDALARHFPPWKLLLLHRITGSARLDRILPELLAEWRAEQTASPPDVTALRSLALRLFVMEGRPGSPGEGLDQFVDAWAPLHRSRASRPAAKSAAARLGSRNRQAINAALGLVRRRAPFLKLGRRPRVAVCITGQLRGYRRAFPSWREGLLHDIDHEIFVHSWEKIGRSGAEPYRAYLPFAGAAFCEAYRAQANRAGMPEMQARYPHLFAALRQGGVVTPAELSAFYGTDHVVLEDDADPAFDGWSNGKKMHYKIAAASALIADRHSEFDLVLRARPDKQLGLVAFSWRDMLAATAASPVIFADKGMGQQYGQVLIGDQLALGAPDVMTAYADTFDLLPRLAVQNLAGCKADYEGHVSLAYTCWHAGIDVQRLPVRIGGLMEAEPMSAPDIAVALEQDAAGRMDHMDGTLLAAIHADLGGGDATAS